MKTKLIPLIICHTCQSKLNGKDVDWTVWENSIYCEPCFQKYLQMIDEDVFDVHTKNKENS